MPVVQEKWVTNPLAVIKQLFESENSGGEGENWGVLRFFEEKLKTEAGQAAVPLLTSLSSDQLHDGCLVRYRGMVQDQLDTEFYLKKYYTTTNQATQVCCGLYSDLTHLPPDVGEVCWEHPSNIMDDRATLYCVPVPAQTAWLKDLWEGHEAGLTSKDDSGATPSSSRLKRKLDESEGPCGEDMETIEDGVQEGREREDSTGKKHCTAPPSVQQSPPAITPPNLNFPLSDESGVPCLVKVYKEWEELHVCSVVDIVGVLSVHPELAPASYMEQEEDDSAAERRARSPPPSLVPRLHAITINILQHCNPLLPSTLPVPLSSVGGLLSEDVLCARSLAMDALTQVLCGDRLAAEYALLHLLSSVYGRTGTMALGKFSLNLTHCPDKQVVQEMYQLLSNCLTKCLLLPLSLEKLNALRFSPRKDYDSNRLLSGTLQLSAGTEIVVDETALTPGQLSEVGVANITALGNVIQWQKLGYNFEFHTTEFETDLPVLLLSEGRSMIKVDCQVPLTASSPSTSPVLAPAQLALLRRYFTLCQKLHYSLGSPMKQVIEEEFVRQRHGSSDVRSGMSEEKLHQLLCVARLVAISHGSSSLSPQLWTHANALEQNRLQRLPSTTNS